LLKKEHAIALIVFVGVAVYIGVFASNSIDTVPTKAEAPYVVKNGICKYYTKELGEWTPFGSPHLVYYSGYYSRNYLGIWVHSSEQLGLNGYVETENNTNVASENGCRGK